MKKGSGSRVLIAALVVVLILSLGGGMASARGTSPFVIECIASGMTIWNGSTAEFYVDLARISVPLASAVSSGQNQPVVVGTTVSLWALKSNELQVQYTAGPDSAKLIVASNVCGTIPSVIAAPAPVAPVVTLYPFYWPYYTPQPAIVAVQPVVVQPAPAWSGKVHVVQPGENLFRIALKYGLTYTQLAAFNGITNPGLIYVGQQIKLP